MCVWEREKVKVKIEMFYITFEKLLLFLKKSFHSDMLNVMWHPTIVTMKKKQNKKKRKIFFFLNFVACL